MGWPTRKANSKVLTVRAPGGIGSTPSCCNVSKLGPQRPCFQFAPCDPFDRCILSVARTMLCKSIGWAIWLWSSREGSGLGLVVNSNSQAPQYMAHHEDTVVEREGSAVPSCCPHWHGITICFPFLGTQHGFRLQLATLTCALLVVGFIVVLTRIPVTTIVPRSSCGGELSVNLPSASEYRPCPSWCADHALLNTMYHTVARGDRWLTCRLSWARPIFPRHPKVPG